MRADTRANLIGLVVLWATGILLCVVLFLLPRACRDSTSSSDSGRRIDLPDAR